MYPGVNIFLGYTVWNGPYYCTTLSTVPGTVYHTMYFLDKGACYLHHSLRYNLRHIMHISSRRIDQMSNSRDQRVQNQPLLDGSRETRPSHSSSTCTLDSWFTSSSSPRRRLRRRWARRLRARELSLGGAGRSTCRPGTRRVVAPAAVAFFNTVRHW